MPQTTPLLMRLFDFTADDLTANVAEHLSDAQIAARRQRFSGAMRLFAYSVLAAMIFISSVVCLLGILVAGVLASPQAGTSVGFLLAIGISALLLYALWNHYLEWERELASDTPASICGEVRKERIMTRLGPIYRIYLGEQSFRITRLQSAAFEEGVTYCIYYTPVMRHILSVEVRS
jgi:hypothetical protein